LILDFKHDIFGLFLTFNSKLFHDWYFEREVAKLEKVQLKSARIVSGLTNLQVEIIFTVIQGGNLCLVDVNIAS
jgi:Na+(H+)/acetate symporter ActP